MNENFTDLVNIATLQKELGVSQATAKKYATESNSAVKISGVTFYSRTNIRVHLRAKHEGLLKFLNA